MHLKNLSTLAFSSNFCDWQTEANTVVPKRFLGWSLQKWVKVKWVQLQITCSPQLHFLCLYLDVLCHRLNQTPARCEQSEPQHWAPNPLSVTSACFLYIRDSVPSLYNLWLAFKDLSLHYSKSSASPCSHANKPQNILSIKNQLLQVI